MPEFYLRMWAEQILYDARDYVVDAPTLEAAVTLLRDVQEEADLTCRAMEQGEITGMGGQLDEVTTLDPTDIVDGMQGCTLLDDDGERLRDLVGCPTGETPLGLPLDPADVTMADVLSDCLAFIDTVWDDGDGNPEPECAKRARAMLANVAHVVVARSAEPESNSANQA